MTIDKVCEHNLSIAREQTYLAKDLQQLFAYLAIIRFKDITTFIAIINYKNCFTSSFDNIVLDITDYIQNDSISVLSFLVCVIYHYVI